MYSLIFVKKTKQKASETVFVNNWFIKQMVYFDNTSLVSIYKIRESLCHTIKIWINKALSEREVSVILQTNLVGVLYRWHGLPPCSSASCWLYLAALSPPLSLFHTGTSLGSGAMCSAQDRSNFSIYISAANRNDRYLVCWVTKSMNALVGPVSTQESSVLVFTRVCT